jgi:hypothetical protein
VSIGGEEIMLKDVSSFKQSTGDEAATKSLGMGVVTHQITGKVYYTSWSMDVKVEGENVVRHMDLMTHNHMSMPGNTPTWPYIDQQAMGAEHPCSEEHRKERAACGPLEQRAPERTTVRANRRTGIIERRTTGGQLRVEATRQAQCANTPEARECQKARKCMLTPFSPNRCCDGETPHHLVEVHGFAVPGDRESTLPQFPGYSENSAPCVCAQGGRTEGTHGDLHAVQGVLEYGAMSRAKPNMRGMAWNYGEARAAGVKALKATFPESKCRDGCIQHQLDNYHTQPEVGVTDSTPLRTGPGALGTTAGSQWQRGIDLLNQLAQRTGGA